MASFSITIPDELVPGIIATATLEGKPPEDIIQEYALALANKTCQDLKVGPYYEGPIPPQFNADGTPYAAPVVTEPLPVDEPTPVAPEPEPVPEPETPVVDEPAPEPETPVVDEPTPEPVPEPNPEPETPVVTEPVPEPEPPFAPEPELPAVTDPAQ